MFKRLKIFLIILGLGVFILPKQLVSAQGIEQACSHQSSKKECCKSQEDSTCHSKDSKENSDKNKCGDDCNTCNSCTIHCFTNFISSELPSILPQHFFVKKLNFDHEIPYFTSNIQNIWQPPKLS